MGAGFLLSQSAVACGIREVCHGLGLLLLLLGFCYARFSMVSEIILSQNGSPVFVILVEYYFRTH